MDKPSRPKPEDFGLTEEDVQKSLTLGVSELGGALGCLIGLLWFGGAALLAFVLGYLTEPAAGFLLFVPLWVLLGFIINRILDPKGGKVSEFLKARRAFDADELRKKVGFWLALKGIPLEQEVASLYSSLGYAVRLTPTSGDQGIDLWVEKDGRKFIVQCKGLAKPAGPFIIRDLYGTFAVAKADGAILVSTNGVTKGVRDFSRGKPIQILDARDLARMKEEGQQ